MNLSAYATFYKFYLRCLQMTSQRASNRGSSSLYVQMTGGILDVSIISFHTTESAKSADVVGNNLIELSLYNPIASHTKLIPTYTAFAICVSTSRFPKVRSTVKILVSGVKMAVLTVVIENILSEEPDMYIMKAFIAICCPGFIAIAIAFCFRFATRTAVF